MHGLTKCVVKDASHLRCAHFYMRYIHLFCFVLSFTSSPWQFEQWNQPTIYQRWRLLYKEQVTLKLIIDYCKYNMYEIKMYLRFCFSFISIRVVVYLLGYLGSMYCQDQDVFSTVNKVSVRHKEIILSRHIELILFRLLLRWSERWSECTWCWSSPILTISKQNKLDRILFFLFVD